MAVFLLAAGLGTRLAPLTTVLPKSLLPVGDRPALAHILERVRTLPGPFVANAHHRAADIRAFLATCDVNVQVSEEARILGTAGGLRAAEALLGLGSVLVWNADILSSLDARALLAAHESGAGDREATLAVVPLAAGEGNVGLDEAGRIVRLRKESVAGTHEARGGAFLAIHVVGERLRRELPEEGCLVGDLYLPAMRAGKTLRAFEVPTEPGFAWHDIGTLDDYVAANLAWLGRRESFVHASASVDDGVTFDRSIVGEGARVEGSGAVERCIVWPGAAATAPLADAVVFLASPRSLRLSVRPTGIGSKG